MNYSEFLEKKSNLSGNFGFDPLFMPDYLKDFQKHLVGWSLSKGRSAIFADCGLGKTVIQLVWAQNVVQKTNGRVLILAPLSVGQQTIREAGKFGIEAHRSRNGETPGKIIVTNYERLHYFNTNDFVGCVCDESSILKNFDGAYKTQVTEFMKKLPYRLLCTATAAPNDYIELGTSAESLGELGFTDMLMRFFKNDTNPTIDTRKRYGGDVPKWRFKHHAELPFWRWVCSWARAIRKPADLGFDNLEFILPPLLENTYNVKTVKNRNGMLFALPAVGLFEQRQERRISITERCEKAAELASKNGASVLWCNLNDEGDLLESITPDSVQVCGSQSDDEKEEKLLAFLNGEAKRLVTKPMCAGFGLNMQHCSHMTFFPSNSYEQYYQGVRRCWRFGQKSPVNVDIVSTDGDLQVLKNLQRKATAADRMFDHLVMYMNDVMSIDKKTLYDKKTEVPKWL